MVLVALWCGAWDSVAFGQADARMAIAEGDLLFVLPATANAITAATGEADHVAIAHRIGGDEGLLYVVEAIGKGVCLTPMDSFLLHNAEADIVVRQVARLDVRRSVGNALRYVGRPYDWNYTPGDSALYCSELVQLCCVDGEGKPVFATIPMRFSDQQGHILPYWQEHYSRQHLPVPEGEPGTNPSQLLRQLASPTGGH